MADGAQLFVRTTEVGAVLDAIEAHVREHGCGGMYEAVDDRVETLSERRDARTFAVAPSTDGWVTVWEDGVLGDRRLAGALSSALATQVRWLLVSESTGTWAAFTYEDGRVVDDGGGLREDGDPAAWAAAASLPEAGVYLPDPTLGRYLAGLGVPAADSGVSAEDLDAALADPPDPAPPGTERRTFPC